MTDTRSYFRRDATIFQDAYCTRCDCKMERVQVVDDLALYCCPKCEPKVGEWYKAEVGR